MPDDLGDQRDQNKGKSPKRVEITLNDILVALQNYSADSLTKMIPMPKKRPTDKDIVVAPNQLRPDENDRKTMISILLNMTEDEKREPSKISATRIKEIAVKSKSTESYIQNMIGSYLALFTYMTDGPTKE